MISYYDIDGRMDFERMWDRIDWDKHKLTVSRIQARIVKASNCRVFNYALTMLEPYEAKVSRTVLRGLGTGNSPRLPGDRATTGFF